MRQRLAELFFGTESQLRIEIGRLEQSNRILKNQRGRAYKALNKDYKALKRKYDEALFEVAVQRRYHGGSYSRRAMEQSKDYIDADVARNIGLQDRMTDLQEKLDQATTMLQKAGLDCCKLVYTKLEEERKEKVFQLSQDLIRARKRRNAAAAEQTRISHTLKELKGE